MTGAVPRHVEQPVWIALNGVRRIVLSCSPHDLVPLALGHLIGEGWVRTRADVLTMNVEPAGTGMGVMVDVEPALPDVVEMMRRHQTLHGCGLRHVLDCDRNALAAVTRPTRPVSAAPVLRLLFAAVDAQAPDGGVHGAAISDGESLLSVATDVARHCAVDRAIGTALHERPDLDGCGLVCTARVSGAMALKAARARLGWIASRSIATSLAREIAASCGMLLLERGRLPADSA